VLSVRPNLCVKPIQLVRCAAANRVAQDSFGGVHDGKLFQELFGLAKRIGLLKDDMAANGPRHRSDKLNDRLMGNADAIFFDAPLKEVCRDLLLLREAIVESINQNVCINESGHADKGPLWPTLDPDRRVSASPFLAFCGDGLLPDRIIEGGIRGLHSCSSLQPELRESHRPQEPIEHRRRGEYRIARR
jgi:hypothetical protein